MVLETLISPKLAEQKPLYMFILGMLYASIAVFLSLWIFKDQASLIVVFLTVLACVPLIYRTIRYEEKQDTELKDEKSRLKSHRHALYFFIYLFMGFTVAFAAWFIFLPGHIVQNLFSAQMLTINLINNQVTANSVTAFATSFGLMGNIIANNLKVLFFCIFFAFFYGAGAIFILTWNASVISAAVGTFVRSNLEKYAAQAGFVKVAAYFHVFSIALLRYMTHGIFEILAYFIGGLAGGLISVAVIRHEPGDPNFRKVMFDALDLFLLAVLSVLVAGVIEVYITPLMF